MRTHILKRTQFIKRTYCGKVPPRGMKLVRPEQANSSDCMVCRSALDASPERRFSVIDACAPHYSGPIAACNCKG